MAFNVLMCY